MTQPLTIPNHFTRTHPIPTERGTYVPQEGFHGPDEGPVWCDNIGDPHIAGDRCGTPVGFMERGDHFVGVSVWQGRVVLAAEWDEDTSAPVDPADARLIAQWLTTAAELVEGLQA